MLGVGVGVKGERIYRRFDVSLDCVVVQDISQVVFLELRDRSLLSCTPFRNTTVRYRKFEVCKLRPKDDCF